ncbi:MAG: Mur ligase domain-containing protein, partial [bacterium]
MPVSAVPSALTLPPPPGPLFLAGLGGIGMSGLAQLLRWQGYTVAGSDRETTGPGRDELYAKLRSQGITTWPQDGSGVRAVRPALLINSTAIEDGNPDFIAATELGCARDHRARALAAALNRLPGRQIAIAGSAGKTSVTAWLASTLHHLGLPVLSVCG